MNKCRLNPDVPKSHFDLHTHLKRSVIINCHVFCFVITFKNTHLTCKKCFVCIRQKRERESQWHSESRLYKSASPLTSDLFRHTFTSLSASLLSSVNTSQAVCHKDVMMLNCTLLHGATGQNVSG